MGLYDEVTVAEGNLVNIPQPKDFYQISSLKAAMLYMEITKEGIIQYSGDRRYLINTVNLDMYGEDHTGYYRRYVLCVSLNRIIAVHEVDDDGNHKEIFVDHAVRQAAQRMLNNMTPLHDRNGEGQ